MSVRVSLRDKPECASGSQLLEVIEITNERSNRWRKSLDRRDGCTFNAILGPWASIARAKHHWVTVEDPDRGTTDEWRLHGIERVRGSKVVGVTCHPAVTILRDMGQMRLKFTGGASRFVIGGRMLTPAQFLEKFVVGSLLLRGIDWVDVGTVESDAKHDITWDRWAGITLGNELEERTWLEFRMRRNGTTNYLLDLVEQIGSDAPQIIISSAKNLHELRRSDIPDKVATVVSGFGGKLPDSPERHTGALATWSYTAVVGDEITGLFDPSGGPPPIILENIYATPIPRFALAVDGTLWEILSSRVADQAMVLETGAGAHFPLGAGLQIRADADGSFLEELQDPESLTSDIATRIVTKDDLRGEAAIGNNWWGRLWTSKPEPFRARIRSAVSSGATSIPLKELAIGKVIPGKSVLVIDEWLVGSYFSTTSARVTLGGGDVADGSGFADVTVSVALASGLSLDSEVIVYPEGLPDGWVDENAADDDLSAILAWRPGDSALEDIPAGITALAAANRQTLYLDGFTPGDPDHYIWPGDIIQLQEGSLPWGIAMHLAIPNGSGEVAVTTYRLVGLGDTWAGSLGVTGGESFKILRPRFINPTVTLPANIAILVNLGLGGGRHEGLLRLPAAHVKPPTGTSMRLRANVLMRGLSSVDETFYEAELDGTPVGDSGAETFALSGAAFGSPNDALRQLEFPLTSGDDEGELEVTVEGSEDLVYAYLLGISAMVGSGEAGVPIIENGAHANRIRQLEGRWLTLLRQTGRAWKVTQRRLRELGIDEEPVLGGAVLLNDEELDVREEMRVFEVSPCMVDPLDTEVTLTTRHDALTTTLARRLEDLKREQDVEGAFLVYPEDL